MAKLLFEDDNGTKHEINLSTVSSKSIKSGDSIIAYYEVGNATPKDSTLALTQLKALLENLFPNGVRVAIIATRNGKKDVEISIKTNKE